eukprot:CCRYP_020156-RA/>CCRYP_020156-RA protein AED:0.37 eAED:0.36 QI:0/0/0/1/0.66/0.75/4/0/434
MEADAAFQAILNDFRDTAIIDSGTTVHLSKESDGLKLTGPSRLSIAVATGQHSQTTATALLPLDNIRPEARITHILPELQPNSLLSVKQLADNGYVTIFHPHDKGVTVHDENDIRLTSQRTALLQGWRDAQGLWRVALKPSVTNVNTDTIAMDRPAPTEAVYNVELTNLDKGIGRILKRFIRGEFAKIQLDDLPDEIVNEYKLKDIATPDGWVYIRITRVDNFGIKYLREEDLDHLIATLRKHYDVALDKEGKEFVKIELDWDYDQGKVHLSIKPYRDKALRQFDNLEPSKSQDSPYPHIPIKYGAAEQFVDTDESPSVGKDEQKHVQKVNGKFLCTNVSQKWDGISRAQRRELLERIRGTQPSWGTSFSLEKVEHPPNNGAILSVTEIIKAVMLSASESELGALFINAKKAVVERSHSRRDGPSATADAHPSG